MGFSAQAESRLQSMRMNVRPAGIPTGKPIADVRENLCAILVTIQTMLINRGSRITIAGNPIPSIVNKLYIGTGYETPTMAFPAGSSVTAD